MKNRGSRTVWLAYMMMVLMMGSTLLNIYLYEQYLSMKTRMSAWVQLAAGSSADYDFSRGKLHFFGIRENGSGEGVDTSSSNGMVFWPTSSKDDREFVNAYNQKLESLIHRK